MITNKRIAVGVFCADWRLHQEGVHINNQLKKFLEVDGVDVLAVPGPDGICVNEMFEDRRAVLLNDLKVLIGAHHPVAVAFVSHQNCAGHPVSNDEHDAHTEAMMQHYKDDLGFTGEMIALCATYTTDTDWGLKEIARIPAAA